MIWGALLLLALVTTAATADVYPGTFKSKVKGLAVTLDVGESGGGTLAYAMKTECGKAKGKLELKRSGAGLRGRKVSQGPQSSLQTVSAKVGLTSDGSEVVGVIKETLRGGHGPSCRAKREFRVDADQSDGFVPTRDEGHYTGTGPNGNPISFDVVVTGGDPEVQNLSADVTADCYDDTDPDGDEFQMVTHITGMAGEVDNDGTFYIDYTPDDDTEYEFDGELADGKADIDVVIGGYFDAAGNPNPAGPYACDSWGDPYTAERG